MHQDSFNQIIDHLQSVLPEEGCGLLAGLGGTVRRVIPIDNALRSRTRFRMDPVQQVEAMHAIRQKGLYLVGIFHSHPLGPAEPSPTDLDEAAYPEVAYLIFWRSGGQWEGNAFGIVHGDPTPMDLVIC